MRKQRKYILRKFQCPEYIVEALEAMKPPDDLSVSEWAERYRILDELSSKMTGPWKNTVTPYLKGIMDEFNSWECDEVIFVKPTQVGGTEAIFNMLGYAIQQDPAPTMIVYPSDKLACTTCESRIMPMINACRSLRKKYDLKGSSQDELKFDNMRWINILRHPKRKQILFPWRKREPSPIVQIERSICVLPPPLKRGRYGRPRKMQI